MRDQMTDTERAFSDAVMVYARENKKRTNRELTDPTVFAPEERPVAVCMAGSPGAGKTEASKELVATIEGRYPWASAS